VNLGFKWDAFARAPRQAIGHHQCHALTAPGTIVEPKPVAGVYHPAAVPVTVTRSATVGDVSGGVHEGANVSWKAGDCGHYAVAYRVVVDSGILGAAAQSYPVTSYDQHSLPR
jgi:hypothetical protein